MSEPNLSVWVGEQAVCIRVAGRASFTCSVDFKTLVNSLRQQGHGRFVLDLTECTLMDSTFVGILANLGSRFSEEASGRSRAAIELLNPNARISDLLDNLGVAQFFQVVNGTAPGSDRLTQLNPVTCNPEKIEISRACLEAHQFLMDISPANVSKFKDVTRFLQEDLQRMEGNGKPDGFSDS